MLSHCMKAGGIGEFICCFTGSSSNARKENFPQVQSWMIPCQIIGGMQPTISDLTDI